MATRPFPVDSKLTAIALAWANPDVSFIADDVLPRTDTTADFKYMKYDLAQGITVPDTKVGRKSEPTVVEFVGTEVSDRVVDQGLDDIIPNEDINDDNQGVDPRGRSVNYLTGLVKLAREQRVSNIVFANSTYVAGQKSTLAGVTQWSDYTNSNPLSVILAALDAVPIYRPNVCVLGQAVWTQLRQHPKIVQAVFKTAQGAGVVTREEFAALLEVQNVYIGGSVTNTAKRGQTLASSRVWGKHASFFYRDRTAGPQSGMTFGFTAQAQNLFSGQMDEPKMGLQGSVRVRVGERVKELVVAPELGYFFENAVA